MSNYTNTSDVLNLLIRISVEMSLYSKIVPSTYIADHFGITKYRARKLISQLKAEGYVQLADESCYSNRSNRYYIRRGYVITDKARHLTMWHQANIRELRIMDGYFKGLDMTSAIKEAEAALAERSRR